MASRRIRQSVVALSLVSAFGLLPQLGALPRAVTPRAAGAVARWELPWGPHGSFWHLLTSLWGKSGAKIDGNG
jgi:hypothetical protein